MSFYFNSSEDHTARKLGKTADCKRRYIIRSLSYGQVYYNICIRDKIFVACCVSAGRKVAFSASLLASGSGHEGPYETVPSPLIYKKVVTNYGNGYDSNTGIFTAPVGGVYYFRFYAHCHADNRMAVSLYKNENIQCSVFSWKPITNGNASNGIVLTLEKGDQMFTKLWQNSWVYDDPAGYTSFSGFLLFPL
ncbi:complement component 1, q subcomponent-like 4 like precursor [Silurus asotus]|uniref:Complement component 1, q subcomponent-like 4 like n=1 Tax=Silurus asotus TaxID=30991 RepID=A0AAD5FEF0_SILAS|nr:complement component 1, q subcomponent-like 4 like precursor [Silurus asotus]